MALVNRNESFGTQVDAVAPRITIEWNPVSNDGTVLFHFETFTTRISSGQLLERAFLGVLPAKISDLLVGEYDIVDPFTGHTYREPAWKLMALIKAGTDRVYAATQTPVDPAPEPEE